MKLESEQSLADDDFAGRIEALRPVLFGYVLSLMPYRDAVDDVIQETCLLLWEKRDEYKPGTNWKAWAFKVAWFKAMSCRRDLRRSKLISFSEATLQRIAGAAEEQADAVDTRFSALRECLAELPSERLELLKLKYVQRCSLADQARQLGWNPNRLQKALSRVRLALKHCIESRLPKNS